MYINKYIIYIYIYLYIYIYINTLVSGNAGDEKNFHPGDRKVIYFYRFSRDIVFSSLVSFDFFLILVFVCLFVCCFLKLKMYMYILVNI